MAHFACNSCGRSGMSHLESLHHKCNVREVVKCELKAALLRIADAIEEKDLNAKSGVVYWSELEGIIRQEAEKQGAP